MGALLLLRYHSALHLILSLSAFMQWFINYQQDRISPSDRGLAYGDGLFETIKASPKGFEYLNDHLLRLERGLAKLSMPFPTEKITELRLFLFNTILPLIKHEMVVKIIVTRGEGGRGYLPAENAQHTVLVGIGEAPDYQREQQSGVHLGVSDVPVNSNPYLSGIKHLNRLENVLAKQKLNLAHFEDVMLNHQGHVIECIQSNIFWFKDGTLHTPSLSQSGVQGVFRHHVLATQADRLINIGHFSLNALKQADEIFITNSLMGIVPVISLLGDSMPIGLHTQGLQRLMKNKDVHDTF
ncbi:aminodeoxychorismate lyase [Marinomonas pollencensis]|uniref:Aminodeoxychorismate lyase n=1 Tax=Marinomonas pollencensis TaxID=491954 RepID=A0A3E0DRV5_9GAMM|nr:aminodeoxychorismate lyase [Marinomonas pollencensis]REG85744.1 4-amino-4-deoxychorismate lyase [Marinomonas pollencensis]